MNGMEGPPVRFADSIKLRGAAHMVKDTAGIQSGLGLLEEWVQSSLIKLKHKCNSHHFFVRKRPLWQYGLGQETGLQKRPRSSCRHPVECETAECPGRKSTQRHHRLLWHGLLNRAVIISLSSALTGLCLEYWVLYLLTLDFTIRQTLIDWTEFSIGQAHRLNIQRR